MKNTAIAWILMASSYLALQTDMNGMNTLCMLESNYLLILMTSGCVSDIPGIKMHKKIGTRYGMPLYARLGGTS
jgi:hypothetical protein